VAAPFMGESPFPDPSQLEGLQQAPPEEGMAPEEAAEPMPEGAPPEQAPPPEPEGEDIDLEGALAEAIEAGCQLCEGAVTAEDFRNFAQGVSHLSDALSNLQPTSDSDEAQMAIAQIRAAAQLEVARIGAEATASRPTASESSARG
jgi:hypothetical protein